MGIIPTLAYVIDLGWFRIGPPYVYLNIDPVIVHLGPLALRWYGLMYAIAIAIGLRIITGYTTRKGIDQDMVYRVLWWCIVAGLIGGRLYFVIQQPNLVSYYLTNPIHIIATWEGGMAFYGAIFLVLLTLVWRARIEHINPLVLLDAGVLFGAAGQIFGRIGNIINGDIIGYPSTLPWSTVYQNPNSWACLNPATCHVPVQPASVYELLTNIVVLTVLLWLARRVARPGVLLFVYLFSYTVTQFLLFFVRANDVVSFLGLHWGLKQAQWTSLVLFIILLPLTYLVMRSRFARPVPAGEDAATYGILQPPTQSEEAKAIDSDDDEAEADHEDGEPIANVQTEDAADAQEEHIAVASEEPAKDVEDVETEASKGS